MSFPKTLTVLVTVLFSSPLFLSTASAQFTYPGRIQLPQYDFTWTWGDESMARGSFNEMTMIGGESGFRCELSATMRVSSRLSRQQLQQLENDIRQDVYFVQASVRAMNMLEAQRELGYASLACERPQADVDADEEKRAAREASALERAARERERRRARRAREEADQ